MMKESKLNKILSFIHIVVIQSMLIVLTSILSVGILIFPSLISGFNGANDYLKGDISGYDNITKSFVKDVRANLAAVKHSSYLILAILNIFGIGISIQADMRFVGILCLVNVILLFLTVIYISACASRSIEITVENVLNIISTKAKNTVVNFVLMAVIVVFAGYNYLFYASIAIELIILFFAITINEQINLALEKDE